MSIVQTVFLMEQECFQGFPERRFESVSDTGSTFQRTGATTIKSNWKSEHNVEVMFTNRHLFDILYINNPNIETNLLATIL